MASKIDLNADLGESYGRWVLGNDEELMHYISSANIACGYHAGDPHVMRRTVRLALQHGVGIGAHVSLPDLMGFGRRRMDVAPEEVRDYVVYQVGALAGFVRAEGGRLAHVKPHGALYVMCSKQREYAQAVAEAVREVAPNAILLLTGGVCEAAAREVGIRFVNEGYVDLDYDREGNLIIERRKAPRDPEEVARRAVSLAKEGRVRTREGSHLELQVGSICIHGDAPNAVEIAQEVRRALEEAGVSIVPLPELF